MKFVFGLVLAILIVALVSTLTFSSLSNPVESQITSTKVFVVNKGDSVKSIGGRLQQNGLIKNHLVFLAHAYILGLTQKLQAGSFDLSPSLSSSEIVQKLSQGGRLDVWVRIIDGQRNEEIVQSLFERKSFEAVANSKLGYLYPDTYAIPSSASLDQFFQIIDTNYHNKIATIKSGALVELSENQQVILASIIEREARTITSKQYVAGILLNRLKIGMPLQIDATVQYARDSRVPAPKEYWLPLAKKDLSIISPYNTYLNAGLPPGPICNPGYDSLYAAYHPTTSDYLFYITGNDNKMHYAKTLTEHNANVAKYLR